MVRLTKIYTRSGDDGTTGLVGGSRVSKDDLRVEAYGTVDEANACIGWAISQARQIVGTGVRERAIARELSLVQHELFDLGADLATPEDGGDGALRIVAGQVERLEGVIDRWNEGLGDLKSFVLPGGSALSASLHVARAVVRRAERICVSLASQDKVNPDAIRYLNRLSDLLFVFARAASDGREVLWEPGSTRSDR